MSFIRPTSSLYKKDCYPLLLISNLLNLSYKAQVYIKIDFCYTYYLVHIANSNKWKIAFKICYRLFKQSVILFSLTNALMTFQQFINNVFSKFLNVYVMIYLDDILIYLNNMSKHHWYMKEVLIHLQKTSFYIKVEKYKFYSKLVEYLGYILSFSSLTMSNNKVKIIQDWPESKKVKDI